MPRPLSGGRYGVSPRIQWIPSMPGALAADDPATRERCAVRKILFVLALPLSGRELDDCLNRTLGVEPSLCAEAHFVSRARSH